MAVFKNNKSRFSLRPSKGIALQTFTKIVDLKVNTMEPFLCTKVNTGIRKEKLYESELYSGNCSVSNTGW